MRRALPLLLLALVGCGSAAPDELPPAYIAPPSPPPAAPPAGTPLPSGAADVVDPRRAGRAAIRAGRLRVGGRAVRGLLDPVAVAEAPTGDLLVVDGRTRELVRLHGRTLEVLGRADAGIGPTSVIAGGEFAYVADTGGDAVLVFDLRGRAVDPLRYVHLPGAPSALAIDRRTAFRVWVALAARNEVVGLPAHGRPRPVERFPTVRGPHRLGADPETGSVTVLGRGGAARVVAGPA